MASLVGVIVVTAILLGVSIWQGLSPLLGLDLQGGVEVVLQPTADQDDYDPDDIDTAVEIIRRRVDALGVAEPDITRQGDNVVVQLPGVDNQQRAIELIGQTAELTFRPVLMSQQVLFASTNSAYLQGASVACGLIAGEIPDELLQDRSEEDAEAGEFQGPLQNPEAATNQDTTTTTEPPAEDDATTTTGQPAEDTTTTTEPPAEETTTSTTEEPPVSTTTTTEPTEQPAEETTTTTTTEPPEEPTEAEPVLNSEAAANLLEFPGAGIRLCDLLNGEIDDPQETDADEIAVFSGRGGLYLLAPAGLTGSGIESAEAQFSGVNTWSVNLTLKSGEEGIDSFNDLASTCHSQNIRCPTQQLAIELDGFVESAPNVNEPVFERDQIQITGGFTEREARDLELVLRYGALPVEFEDPAESGLVRTVSATLGRDSLRAGVIAGIVGMTLVAAYILFYYRLLGALALLSLMLSGTMLWVVVSFLSETRGLALTLAGITGLIVSLGVSLDSNVVYFEHLKEGVVNGRTVISSVSQAFPVAFKTIFWANLATLIGAAILWWLTIGSVKGFAAMLAIASILDLVATYFFLRPAVRLLAGTSFAKRKPIVLGMPSDIVVDASPQAVLSSRNAPAETQTAL